MGRGLAVLVAVVLVAAACLTAHDILVGNGWALVEVHGAPPVADATVSFGSNGEFTVETGCNSAGGTYHLDGNRILLDTVHQTLVLCEGDLAAQEAGILAMGRDPRHG